MTSLVWGTLDEQIVTGHDNGDIVQWDVKTQQKVKIVSDHAKSISDMQLSADSKINTSERGSRSSLSHSSDSSLPSMLAGTMFISASKDTSAKLFDIDSLECHKTYQTERPVNSASISPTQDHVSAPEKQISAIINQYSVNSQVFHLTFLFIYYLEILLLKVLFGQLVLANREVLPAFVLLFCVHVHLYAITDYSR